ncbi:uncharacterized protein MICPUCDRAFT_34253 [Micromonas pusilla CCMP1545]|uniref:Predicted protein n=1 Tax=Micromonas pusilla (strain CCMP1545) TaxID=564608 RepID=C1MVQ8_MICPC|nr:uncharacterized protein MICPUCDRAFT_34253 [Micromonas pusilla CCMP1545]EEH55744.1 predicted protein [Micromonas pusilla CCMP1545]|eukprot:XP_003059792.1 predicted protein [Micromonas pusilla CCMP1545]
MASVASLAASASAAVTGRALTSRRAAARASARTVVRAADVLPADGRTLDRSGVPNDPANEGLYDVTLPKPVGVKFARGNDGGAYVVSIPPEPMYDCFAIGDKVTKVSASFGDEIWDADSYGQIIYAMKNRNGDIYLQLRQMNGDLSALEQNEKSSGFKNERAGGNYGAGTKEQQMQNYSKKKELEVQRLDMFDEAIALYNKSDFDSALIIFEEVAALEPKNYMSDNFETATEIYRVSQYNIACCFSKLGQLDNSLKALRQCMGAGWKDFKKIRTDPSLSAVQAAPGFKELMDKFDEPLINENAIKFVKGLFGGK